MAVGGPVGIIKQDDGNRDELGKESGAGMYIQVSPAQQVLSDPLPCDERK